MQLPFSEREFLEVFGSYNTALWPGALALWVASVAVLVLVLRGQRIDRLVSLLLAVHWAWAAIAYHFAYFAPINPAALLFGVLFLLEALLLGWAGLKGEPIRYGYERTARHMLGIALAVYALSYPFLAMALVQPYPSTPTFGVPCPTTLFTVGLFLMSTPTLWRLAAIPLLWTAIGGSAALLLGVVTDFALLGAGVFLITYIVARMVQKRRAT
ncbi:DUF6064 family protein [Aquisalimonas sp.]|uniref:DUF6064 family protein n=1 Tax=Aquisalimonas sp. TaxID=1872621 RepID=UPI0025BEADE6|nr:DUF6064 family protein [Aquisalimonas sp.]